MSFKLVEVADSQRGERESLVSWRYDRRPDLLNDTLPSLANVALRSCGYRYSRYSYILQLLYGIVGNKLLQNCASVVSSYDMKLLK